MPLSYRVNEKKLDRGGWEGGGDSPPAMQSHSKSNQLIATSILDLLTKSDEIPSSNT